MEFWLIRHTTPKVNKGTCYGQLDLDVEASFNEEMALIKKALNTLTPESVYTSPLKRCKKLANALFPAYNIIYDKRLTELNFGDWEGLLWTEIPLQNIDNWSDNFIQKCPPGGESFQSLINRVDKFEDEIILNHSKRVAIITHAGVIRAFIMKYLNIPSYKIFSLQLNYGAIIKITVNSEEYQQVEFIKG